MRIVCVVIAAVVALSSSALCQPAGTGAPICSGAACGDDIFSVGAFEVDAFPPPECRFRGQQGCQTLGWSFVIAQAAPSPQSPTDQEIAAAKKEVCGDDKRVGMGPLNNRNPDMGKYKPEWRARCEAIDAEHEKRGLAAKAKEAGDQGRLDSIISRLPKK